MKNIQILLTGASGLIGASFLESVSCLHEQNKNIMVHALVRKKLSKSYPFVKEFVGDLTHIPDEIFFKDSFVTIHLAVCHSEKDKQLCYETNVEGTLNLLNCLEKTASLGILYSSSLSVLGIQSNHNSSEVSPKNPQTYLAETRSRSEELMETKMKQAQKSAFFMRTRFIIGVNEKEFFKGFSKLVSKNIKIGNGTQEYSIISTDDYSKIIFQLVQKVYELSAKQEFLISPINVCYSKSISFNKIYTLIKPGVGKSDKPFFRLPHWFFNLISFIKIPFIMRVLVKYNLIYHTHTMSTGLIEGLIGQEIVHKDPELEFSKVYSCESGK